MLTVFVAKRFLKNSPQWANAIFAPVETIYDWGENMIFITIPILSIDQSLVYASNIE